MPRVGVAVGDAVRVGVGVGVAVAVGVGVNVGAGGVQTKPVPKQLVTAMRATAATESAARQAPMMGARRFRPWPFSASRTGGSV